MVPRIPVSVDLVVLTVRCQALSALVWRRDKPPYEGRWALSGGFIQLDEDLPAAAARALAERPALPRAPGHLAQLQPSASPHPAPRQRVLSVAYLGLAPDLPASTEAHMSWQPVSSLSEMAFDHRRIMVDGIERARGKLEYT